MTGSGSTRRSIPRSGKRGRASRTTGTQARATSPAFSSLAGAASSMNSPPKA
nr:MAG TPA: hypothetical protein [Caudoviricetes sp.]